MTQHPTPAPRLNDLRDLAAQAELRALRGQPLIPADQHTRLLMSRTRFARPPRSAPRLLQLLWAHAETRTHQHEHLTPGDWARVRALLRELSRVPAHELSPMSTGVLDMMDMVVISQDTVRLGGTIESLHSDESVFWTLYETDQRTEIALALRVADQVAQAGQPLTPLNDPALRRVLDSHHDGLNRARMVSSRLAELIGPPSHRASPLMSIRGLMGLLGS